MFVTTQQPKWMLGGCYRRNIAPTNVAEIYPRNRRNICDNKFTGKFQGERPIYEVNSISTKFIESSGYANDGAQQLNEITILILGYLRNKEK